MKRTFSATAVTLAVLASLALGALRAHAQGSDSKTTEQITRPNTGKSWKVPFDDTTVRTLRASSTAFDPVIVVVHSDGRRQRFTGTRGTRPAEVRLHGNPGSMGWVTVIVGGNGTGAIDFELIERPHVPGTTPQQPPPPPAAGVNLEARLVWHDRVDLDLWVTEPNGRVINYQNKNQGGGNGAGSLDVDNTQGGPNSHELYTVRNGPTGDYQFQVKLFRDGRPQGGGQGQPVRCTVTFHRNGVQVGEPREVTLSVNPATGHRRESNIITP